MSTTFQATVTCHGCAGTFPAELYSNLHVTRSPERREQILAGQFMVFPCPHCARTVRVQPSMLYTDFERFRWYATFPSWAIRHRGDLERRVEEGFQRNMVVACPPMVRAWAPRFFKRVVYGLPSLKEKLLCDDHGLDDRVLEIFKVQLLRDLAPEAFLPDTSFHLDSVGPELLDFVLTQPQGGNLELVRRFGVRRDAMNPILAIGEALPQRFPSYYSGITVDWRAPFQPDLPLPLDPHAGHRLRTPWMPELGDPL